jgi:hypothetical protein
LKAIRACRAIPTADPGAGPITNPACARHDRSSRAASAAPNIRRRIMGKYVLGWFLGIPVVVLVVLYMIFH